MPTLPPRAWLAGIHLAGTSDALRIPNAIGAPREPSNLLKRFKATLRVRVVMDILGHTQMATTADLYSHVMPAAHKDVADLLDRAMLAQG